MSRAKRFARIAITLPEKDLAAADRLAKAQDRSRSWIVAEAIRRFAVGNDAPSAIETGVLGLDESAARDADAQRGGLGASRLAQLVRDMALTPEARVRAAEETLRLTEQAPTPRTHTVRAFDRYLDFLDWKRDRWFGQR